MSSTSQLHINNLLSAIGSSGKYQTLMIVMCCFLVMQNGAFFLTSAYNYAVTPYSQCPAPHQGISLCTKYVCSLPFNQRAQYENQQIAQLKTLGNQFGNYHCSKEYQISVAMGLLWVGAVIGSIIFSTMSDNQGRKRTIIIAQAVAVVGLIVTLLAPTLLVAQIGMFLVGASKTGCFATAFCFLKEFIENQRRQKIAIFVQVFYPLGGFFVIIFYAIFKDWHVVFISLALVPQIISLLFSIFYLKQTPQFLIKLKPAQQVYDSLLFIAGQNGNQSQFLSNKLISVQNIEDLKERYAAEMQHRHMYSHLTLCTFVSLRVKTICSFFMWFCIGCIYFMPFLLVNQFGFNFYINGILLATSQVVTYPFVFKIVNRVGRKKIFYATAVVIFICAFVLIFLDKGTICTSNCWNAGLVVELVLFFILLFSGGILIQVLIIFLYQLFPVQVTALGMGMGQIALSLANIILPSLILLLSSINFPVMAVFCLIAIIFICSLIPLPETLGAKPAQLIEDEADYFDDCDQI